MSAARTLATVRASRCPVVHVNVAQRQVNVATSAPVVASDSDGNED
jgi:hypothetical protein